MPSQAFTLIDVPADLNDGNFGFTVNGKYSPDQSGFSVAKGDVNGDGIIDLIIGAPATSDPTRPGSVSVVFGPFSKEIDLRTNGPSFLGEASGDNFGYSVDATGDFNGDGINDIAVGAILASPGERGAAGKAYVIYGALDFVANGTFNVGNLTRAVVFNGALGNDYAGYFVKMSKKKPGVCSELMIGAPIATPPNGRGNAGSTYIVSGNNNSVTPSLLSVELSLLNSAADNNGFKATRIDGAFQADGSGYSGAIGDFNGDGKDDYAIGAFEASRFLTDTGGTAIRVGAVSVIFGGDFPSTIDLLSYLNGTNGFHVYGRAPSDRAGSSVAARQGGGAESSRRR